MQLVLLLLRNLLAAPDETPSPLALASPTAALHGRLQVWARGGSCVACRQHVHMRVRQGWQCIATGSVLGGRGCILALVRPREHS